MKNIEIYCTEWSPNVKELQIPDECSWGELKRLAGISGNNWTGVGRISKVDYVNDQAMIDHRDDTIGVYPQKMKAGAIKEHQKEELVELYSQIDELKEKVKELILDITDLTEKELVDESGVQSTTDEKYREMDEMMKNR